MKKLLRLVFLLTTIAVAQNNFFQYRILNPIGGATATGHTLFAHTAGLAASYSSINWAVTGTLAACTVQVDYSTDGSTVAGQLIAAQTCTSNGTFTAASTTTPAYVRVSYIIGSGGGTLSFAAYGCNNSTCSGSGGGSLSSLSQGAGIVLTPNPVTTTGTVALNVALPNGETATTQSNGDGTTKVATDAFVLNNAGSGFSGSLTANKVTKATGAHALADSSGFDDGVVATIWPLGLDISTAGAYDFQIPNNASPGTTTQKTVCDDGTGKGVICSHTTSTANVVLGFCVNGCGTTGNATVSMLGWPTVIFDNQTTARHYAVNSTTVDGDLHDTGSATPPSGQPFYFVFTANAGAGTAGQIRMIIADDFIAATPTSVNKIQVNGTQLTLGDAINLNNSTPSAGSNGKNITVQTSKSGTTDSVSFELVGNGTASTYLDGTGSYSTPAGTGVTSVTIAGTTNQITVTGTCTITSTGTCTLSLPSTLVLPNGTTATTQAQLDGSTKVSTTSYVDTAVSNAIAGVNPAVAVLAASTAALTGTYTQVGGGVGDFFTITATGAFTLDGVAINTIGQRVLFKNQATAAQNGVYTATIIGAGGISPVFTRALDYDTPSDVNNTGIVPVQSGTVNSTTSWLLTSQVISIGSAGSSLTYAQFSLAPSTIVTSVSPGVGIGHFAGSTQALTSSLIVAADITNATITHTQTDSTFPTLVASGTSAMGTGAISSGTCATVVTTSATGTATTDTIIATPNADPTGVTGYAVASGGSLYIQAYPTSNNVNFKVCNPTSGSLTPSALTLNWKVIR